MNLKIQGAPSESSNWGLYGSSAGPDIYHVSNRFQANTWSSPTDQSRVLFVYDATTKTLQYFISYQVGSYSRKANISIPQTAIDGQAPGNEISFGKPWDGPGGTSFSGAGYDGTLADCVLSPHAWTELQIQEYFSVGPDQLSTLDVWDRITSYIVPGTEFPAVIDLKGSLSGGALHNGQPTDFVP